MSLDLTKGSRIDLQKAVPGLKRIRVGLGWEENKFSTGTDYDLDVTAFVCKHDKDGNPKCENESSILFYGSLNRTEDNKTSFVDTTPYPKRGKPCTPGLELIHSGDNLTGSGEGDDETILVNVEKILAIADEVSFVITIHDAAARKQNFGQISKSYVKVYNDEDGTIIAKYDLEEGFSTETAVQVGSLYKNPEGHLAFKAVGQGYNLGLGDFCTGYGLTIK